MQSWCVGGLLSTLDIEYKFLSGFTLPECAVGMCSMVAARVYSDTPSSSVARPGEGSRIKDRGHGAINRREQ